jgi:endo-alpha-1,4-polygalactosaminidase (GH114 family)
MAGVLTDARPVRWVVFYGIDADESVLADYDVVVLDAGFRRSITRMTEVGARVCGYVSLGEVRTSDPSWPLLDQAALLQENADWPGTRRVDVRHPSWRSFILNEQVPRIVSRGFNGLMLDTLDTPPFLEQTDPAGCRGMGAAAVDLVRSIRSGWPELTIVMNRGYALLPALVHDIDAVVAESFLTTTDPNGEFRWLDPSVVQAQLGLLRPVARRRPPLPVLSLASAGDPPALPGWQ